jgi:hypothetical protein
MKSTEKKKILEGTGIVVVATGVLATAKILYDNHQLSKNNNLSEILSDEKRYETDKELIEEAIQHEDWETLKQMLNSSTSDFPNLINMIEDALSKQGN